MSTERYEVIAIVLLVELELLVVFADPCQCFLPVVCFFLLCLLSPGRVRLQMSCRAGGVVRNSFHFCLGHFPSLLLFGMTALLDK